MFSKLKHTSILLSVNILKNKALLSEIEKRMSGITFDRLSKELNRWREDHPIGFYANPKTNTDGTTNMLLWEFGFPGKMGTPWEGGLYKGEIILKEHYPFNPPIVKFVPDLFHPNLWPNGTMDLHILMEDQWRPVFTIKEILLSAHELLHNPNMKDPSHAEAYLCLLNDEATFDQKVRDQARSMKADWLSELSHCFLGVVCD